MKQYSVHVGDREAAAPRALITFSADPYAPASQSSHVPPHGLVPAGRASLFVSLVKAPALPDRRRQTVAMADQLTRGNCAMSNTEIVPANRGKNSLHDREYFPK
jgi:hypothetical protein